MAASLRIEHNIYPASTRMPQEPAIRPPYNDVNAARYDNECQDALAAHLDELLDRAENIGWNRSRAASALMYLAAKRLNTASR